MKTSVLSKSFKVDFQMPITAQYDVPNHCGFNERGTINNNTYGLYKYLQQMNILHCDITVLKVL